jgi:hypothetical protein
MDSSGGSASKVIDIGSILDGSVDYNELSPQDFYNYLKNHYVPKRNEVVRQEVVKGKEKKKTLVFQFSWLDTFKMVSIQPTC